MSRRMNKHQRPTRPLGMGHSSAAHKSDGRWIWRSVPGERATKSYTCPGCGHPIGVGVAHVVAWPDTPAWGTERAADARRHWHSSCWSRKR